jgi:hypothetical protein
MGFGDGIKSSSLRAKRIRHIIHKMIHTIYTKYTHICVYIHKYIYIYIHDRYIPAIKHTETLYGLWLAQLKLLSRPHRENGTLLPLQLPQHLPTRKVLAAETRPAERWVDIHDITGNIWFNWSIMIDYYWLWLLLIMSIGYDYYWLWVLVMIID